MNRIISMTLVTLFVVSCSHKDQVNSLTANGLKGRVKSVTSVCYDIVETFGEIQKGKLIELSDEWIPLCAGRIMEFSDNGNLQTETFLNANGDILRVLKYEWIGNSAIAMYAYEEDGELAYSWKTIFDNEKPKSIERYSRYEDSNGETIECDFDGLHIITERHYKDGNLVKIDKNEYHDNLLIKSTSIDQNGNVTLLMEQDFIPGGQFLTRHYTTNGEDGIIDLFTYNEQNFPIRYTRHGQWTNAVDYTFKYSSLDHKGNWLSRVVYVDNKPIAVEERVINYF